MTVIVFTGPTLSPEEARRECDVVCLPPVSQGDVYRVVQQRVRAVGIIDGYFSGAPSVWHKEILYALSQSIPVFGSASMGALRAAELSSFGMKGVGRIFEAYRDGIFEDDDEVAVIHGPLETGFVALSEAMVNIRATLAKAEAEEVLSTPSRTALEMTAKALFFHQRDWPLLLEAGQACGTGQREIEALRAWLPQGRIDQKREDALAMLGAMRRAEDRPAASSPGFRFERTHFWDELIANAEELPLPDDKAGQSSEHILDELRLVGPEAFKRVKLRALLRQAGEARSTREGRLFTPEALQLELTRLRAELRLFTRAELDAWLSRNDLDEATLEKLLLGRVHFGTMMGARGPSLAAAMLDELRLSGTYEGLATRARQKGLALAQAGDIESIARRDGAALLAARMEYLERHGGSSFDCDVSATALDLGFRDLDHFDTVLRKEQIYTRLQLQNPSRTRGSHVVG